MPKTTIIIADTINQCMALKSVLELTENIQLSDWTENTELGLMMIKENRPDIVFLSVNKSSEDIKMLLNLIKRESPKSYIIIITENHKQLINNQVSRPEAILHKGFTLAQVNELLETILV